MNIQEIYTGATKGKLTVDEKGSPLTNSGLQADLLNLQLESQQHMAWLELPQTKAFLGYLEKTASDLVEIASSASMTAESDMDIRLLMVQHNKIKEILDYARRNSNISSSQFGSGIGLGLSAIAGVAAR